MNTIKSVSARNLKGANFTHVLGKVTIIHGNNFAGKTSVLDAIRVALLGYAPEIGKRNLDTFRLASAARMTVEATLSNDTVVARSFMQQGASVTQVGTADKALPDGAEAGLGIMLNPSEYFGLSEKKRIDYIFGLLAGGGSADDKVLHLLKEALKKIAIEDAKDGLAEKVIQAMCKVADNRWRDAKGSIAEFLSLMDAQFVAEISNYRASIERMGHTVTGVTEMRLLQEQLGQMGSEDYTAQIAVAHARRREIGGLLGAVNAQIQANQRNAEKKAAAKKVLDEYRGANPITDWEAKAKKLHWTISGKGGYAATLVARDGKLTILRQRVADTRRELKAEFADRAKLELDQKNFDSLESCPTCGASGSHWKSDHLKKLTTAIAEANAAIKFTENILEREANDLQLCEAEYANLEDDVRTLNSEFKDLLGAIEAERAAQEAHAKAQAAYDAIPEPTPGDERQSEALRNEDFELEARISKWQNDQQPRADLKAKISVAAQAEEQHKRQAVEYAAWKAGKVLLDAEKARLVTGAFDAILKPANRIWRALCAHPLAYHDGDIGYWLAPRPAGSNNSFVSFKAFSGTEQALCHIAVAIGVASLSPLKLCLLDECGRLDEANQDRLIDAVRSLVEQGVIDQFIGVSTAVTPHMKSCAGVTLIKIQA